MDTRTLSLTLDEGGRSQIVPITGTSTQSTVFTQQNTSATISVLYTGDVLAYARQGVDPTAVATGADVLLLPGNTYRLQIPNGTKIAIIAASATEGLGYLTQEL